MRNMNNPKELTYEMVMQMFVTSSEKLDADLKKSREEAEKRNAEAEKRSAEAEKRSAEAEKRSAEFDKQLKELKDSLQRTGEFVDKTALSIQNMREENTATFQRTSDFVDKTTLSIQNMREELGGMGKSNGEMAEELLYNSLERNRSLGGIEFYDIDRNWDRNNKQLKMHAEFDIVLVNGDTVALIEAKHRVRNGDADKFVNKVTTKFKKLYPKYADYKILLGIGGMSFEGKSIEEAKEQGIIVIKVSTEKVEYFAEEMKVY